MVITIGKYRVQPHMQGYVLETESVNRKGEVSWRADSYYGYLEHALEEIQERLVKSKHTETIGEVIAAFQDSKNEVVEAARSLHDAVRSIESR